MVSSLFKSFAFVGALLALGSHAKPVVIRSSPVLNTRSQAMDEALALQERALPPMTLGEYSLATSHVNDVLFNLGVSTNNGNVGETARLQLTCVDCRTWGSALVTTTGVNKDDNVIKDIISFFKDPVDTVMGAFGLDVKISFDNVGGHFAFDMLASDTLSYSYPLFMSTTPAGTAVSEEVSIGMVVFIDLVFSLTAEIDMEAGFEFSFPEGAYITVDPLGGHIVDQGFTGGEVNHLPVTVKSGSATFKAALRVRVQGGTTVMCFGTGFDFELGVYADLIEYKATLGSSDKCELLITENLDVNIGAFAHAVAEINYKTFGAMPALVTTILEVPLPSLCLTRPAATTIAGLASGSAVPNFSMTASETGAAMSQAAASSTSVSASGSVPFFSLLPSSTAASGKPLITPAPSSGSGIIYSNTTQTITSAASLTTSTVYATSVITVTSCASTVLHCPASAASEIVITSTVALYTTVCPVGAVLPTTLPASSSPTAAGHVVSAPTSAEVVIQTVSHLVSPIALTPCATPEVKTIYTPTFVNPTYVMPTATSFAIPYPNWNVTSTVVILEIASTSTALGVLTSSAASTTIAAAVTAKLAAPSYSGVPKQSVNGTSVANAKPTTVSFTGSAAGGAGLGGAGLSLVIAMGMAFMVLL